MSQISVHGSSDRRTPRVDTLPTTPNLPPEAAHPQHASVSWKNTSRVPGLTRNSGWRAVQAEIVRTRPVPGPPGVPTGAGADLPATPWSGSWSRT